MSLRPRAASAIGVVAIAIALPACRTPASEPGSCTCALTSNCMEYDAARATAGERMCRDGVWKPGRCARENALGACDREHGAYLEIFYAGPPNQYTREVAEHLCTSTAGTWHPL